MSLTRHQLSLDDQRDVVKTMRRGGVPDDLIFRAMANIGLYFAPEAFEESREDACAEAPNPA